jgi:hypothetical protein
VAPWTVRCAAGVNAVASDATSVSVTVFIIRATREHASRREGGAPTLGELFMSDMNRSTSFARGGSARRL